MQQESEKENVVGGVGVEVADGEEDREGHTVEISKWQRSEEELRLEPRW